VGKHKTISQMVTVIVGLILLAMLDLQWQVGLADSLEKLVYIPLLWITVAITAYSGGAYFWKNRQLVFPPTS